MRALGELADSIVEAWHDPAKVRELAGHVNTLREHVVSDRGISLGGEAEEWFGLRLQSLSLLNALGDSTGQAALAATQLAADCEEALGADHHHTLVARANLVAAYRQGGLADDAITLGERTLCDLERTLGSDDLHTLNFRRELALAYHRAGWNAKAIPLLERTLADRERTLGPDHPRILSSRNDLAHVYLHVGRTADAIPILEQTVTDWERILGTDNPRTLTSRKDLSSALRRAGRTVEAIELAERTVADSERILGSDHPSTLGIRHTRALACLSASVRMAIRLLEQNLTDAERVLGRDHMTRSGAAAAILRLPTAQAGQTKERASNSWSGQSSPTSVYTAVIIHEPLV